MISVDIAGHRFQLRAAAVVVHDGLVLLHRLVGDAYWALPGDKPNHDIGLYSRARILQPG